jgi:hypothetical protein
VNAQVLQRYKELLLQTEERCRAAERQASLSGGGYVLWGGGTKYLGGKVGNRCVCVCVCVFGGGGEVRGGGHIDIYMYCRMYAGRQQSARPACQVGGGDRG